MTLYQEILAAYRGAGASMRRQMVQVKGEERLLVYIVLACLLLFVARVPGLMVLAQTSDNAEITPTSLIGTSFAITLFFAPLFFYAIAAFSHMIAQAFGGKGSYFEARLALFWALLVTTPLVLLSSMVNVVVPSPVLVQSTGLIIFLVFAFFWASCLNVAEQFRSFVPVMIFIVFIGLGLTAALRFAVMP